MKDIKPEFVEYFHGTSLNGLTKLLPPSVTNKLNEVGRKKNLDKVFFTKDRNHARVYAMKAVKQFGGSEHLYRVVFPQNVNCMSEIKGATIFTADCAFLEQLY